MKRINYYQMGLKYLLGYHRQNRDVANLLKVICNRFEKIQSIIFYLLNIYKISEARGKWLDYIGVEVGVQRDEIDFGNYFLVNRSHVNTPKLFYFYSSGSNPQNHLSLDDSDFINKIFAYIKTNNSSGTLEDIITAIKEATGADNVELTNPSASVLEIGLCGDNIELTRKINQICSQTISEGIQLKEISNNEQT